MPRHTWKSTPSHDPRGTSIVDVSVGPSRLLDVVPGRSATRPSAWLEARLEAWRQAIGFAALDLSGPYRKTFRDTLGHVAQVADPFHLIRLANPSWRSADDACGTRPSATVATRTTPGTRPGGCGRQVPAHSCICP